MTDRRQQTDDGLSEAEAIERAKQGDAEAFQALYDRHKRRVYSLCLRMTANTAEAEDLAQEAFLQLFRKIGTFRGESAFSTWLHRMSVNVVLMQLRRKNLPVVSLEETMEGDEEGTVRKEPGAPDERIPAAPWQERQWSLRRETLEGRGTGCGRHIDEGDQRVLGIALFGRFGRRAFGVHAAPRFAFLIGQEVAGRRA